MYHSAAGKQRVAEADSQAVAVSHRIQSIYASQGRSLNCEYGASTYAEDAIPVGSSQVSPRRAVPA